MKVVCYKIHKNSSKSAEQPKARITTTTTEKTTPLKLSKSRELRAGIMYRGCDCCKWFGLQDDCPRTGCHGSPECLTRPPSCGPSQFCYGKHLGKKKDKKKDVTDLNVRRSDRKTYFKCFPAVIQDPVPLSFFQG